MRVQQIRLQVASRVRTLENAFCNAAVFARFCATETAAHFSAGLWGSNAAVAMPTPSITAHSWRRKVSRTALQ